MPVRVASTPNLWDRPAGRHMPAAVAALAVSAALHLAVWQQHPVLPIGSLARVRDEARFPALHLAEVHRLPSRPLQRPARFRPEDPGRTADLAAETEDWVRQVEQVLPPTPDLSKVELVGEAGALAGPEIPPARRTWEPRQEIIQIEQQLYAENISVLPRRYMAQAPRVARAPDVTVPWEPTEWIADSGIGRIRAPSAPEGAAPTGPHPEGPASFLAALSREPTQLVEESAVLDEKPEQVTPLKPVEQMLAIEVRTWQPTDEPETVYFEVRIRRRGEETLPVLPKDILLIQDCSESMTQAKLNNCKEGLRRWIEQLEVNDRFELLTFRDTPQRLFGRWAEPTPVNRSIALGAVQRLVSRGKTDVYASLQQVLALDRHPVRPMIAVLVTDGRPTMGMVDSSDIIESFTRACAGRISMFCLGGGRRVNRFLLDMLAYRNRGDSLIIEDRTRIPEAMADLARQVSRPVLTDLSYRFSGIPDRDIYPRTLTHLYVDRPLVLYGRYPTGTPRVVFQVVGQARGRQYDMVFEWDWKTVQSGDATLRTQWAWHRIYHLIGEHVREARPDILRELQQVASRYGLVVPYGTDIPTP